MKTKKRKLFYYVMLVFSLVLALSSEAYSEVIYDNNYTGRQLDELVSGGDASYPSSRTTSVTSGDRLDFLTTGAADWDVMYRLPIASAGQITDNNLNVSLEFNVVQLHSALDFDVEVGISDGNTILVLTSSDAGNDNSIWARAYQDNGVSFGSIVGGANQIIGYMPSQAFPQTYQFNINSSGITYKFPGGPFGITFTGIPFDSSRQIEVVILGNQAYEEYGYSYLNIYATSETPPLDTIPPTVTGTSPASGASDVSVNTSISVTFSEAMKEETVNNSNITVTVGVTPVAGTVSYAGTTATFTPDDPLDYNTTYTATVSTGVQDLAENAMVAPYIWTFTTGESDTVPPTVISTYPSRDEVIERRFGTAITATFSEPLDPSSIRPDTFFVERFAGETPQGEQIWDPIPGANVSYDSATKTAYMLDWYAYRYFDYRVTITTGVKDLANNPLSDNYIWQFQADALDCWGSSLGIKPTSRNKLNYGSILPFAIVFTILLIRRKMMRV